MNRRYLLRKLLLLSAMTSIFFFLSAMPSKATAADYNVYGLLSHVTWTESDPSAKESGLVYGLGVSAKFYPYEQLTLKFKAEGGISRLNYDGQLLFGIPQSTHTNYVTAKFETDAGWIFPLVDDKLHIEPFGGLGFTWWRRGIESTSDFSGLTENWYTVYGKAGLYVEYSIPDSTLIFAEGGVKLPLYTRNVADLSIPGMGQVTLDPQGQISAFAQLGARYSVLQATVFYDSYSFAPSGTSAGFQQPRTITNIYGLMLGIAF